MSSGQATEYFGEIPLLFKLVGQWMQLSRYPSLDDSFHRIVGEIVSRRARSRKGRQGVAAGEETEDSSTFHPNQQYPFAGNPDSRTGLVI